MTWTTNLFHLTILLAASWIKRSHERLINGPKNTVAKMGDRVELECSTSSNLSMRDSAGAIPLEWTSCSSINSSKTEISQSGQLTHSLKSKYAIDNTTRAANNLIMMSVDLSFAGMYTCSGLFSQEDNTHNRSAELIVIASDPVCSSVAGKVIVEGDYIRLCCTVNYSGNWNPVMEWTRNNGRPPEGNITNSIESFTVASSLITRLNLSDNGVKFTCKTNFQPMPTNSRTESKVEATNVPQYQYLWNYTVTVQPYNIATVSHTQDPDNGLFAIIGISVGALMLLIATVTIICKFGKRGYMNERAGTSNHQYNGIPVYAEVNKNKREKNINGPRDQIGLPMPIKSQPKQNYTGADGTQYMELDLLTELKSNGVPVRQPPMFSLVETYATIDHTMAAPPPPTPLPLPRRH